MLDARAASFPTPPYAISNSTLVLLEFHFRSLTEEVFSVSLSLSLSLSFSTPPTQHECKERAWQGTFGSQERYASSSSVKTPLSLKVIFIPLFGPVNRQQNWKSWERSGALSDDNHPETCLIITINDT
jgi:hypothetical protein